MHLAMNMTGREIIGKNRREFDARVKDAKQLQGSCVEIDLEKGRYKEMNGKEFVEDMESEESDKEEGGSGEDGSEEEIILYNE